MRVELCLGTLSVNFVLGTSWSFPRASKEQTPPLDPHLTDAVFFRSLTLVSGAIESHTF